MKSKKSIMKILAVDVGVGTQDIMLFDSDQSVENSTKFVVPSPTRMFANQIRKSKDNLFIKGETMGGGPINRAIKNHLQEGYKVVMTEHSARTIRDDLNFVKSLGIKIVSDDEKDENYQNFTEIELKDVDLNAIENVLSNFDLKPEFDFIGAAVQDHGFEEKIGDRNFRFMKIKEILNIPRKPEEFAYFNKAPNYFTRMNGVLRTLKNYRTTVMDSKFAAICGTTCDDETNNFERFIAIDVGNGHTLAAAFDNGKIFGLFEHHTHSLTPDKIYLFIKKLVDGTLTHEEIHEDGGHGAWVLEPIDEFESVVATGPRRKILQKTDLNVHYAAPAGDVMMTGPVGLIKAIKSNMDKNR